MTSSIAFAMAVLIGVPAFAEIDLSGNWSTRQHQDWQDRNPGPEAVDYIGLPINDEARARALSYSASLLSLPERQCLFYPPQYDVIGPQSIKMWAETEPVTGKTIAWKISAAPDRDVITIWMDGRPHPGKNAPHPYAGFTTGVWQGDVLTAYTTHIKAGYIRRNGVPSSDQATVTQHIMRHGDTLTITALIDDPIYLTEPMIRTSDFRTAPTQELEGYSCEVVTEVDKPHGWVPHWLPGTNPFLDEYAKQRHVPVEASSGGPETMLPEYRKKVARP